jgi:hypothetical protein
VYDTTQNDQSVIVIAAIKRYLSCENSRGRAEDARVDLTRQHKNQPSTEVSGLEIIIQSVRSCSSSP